MYDLNDLVSCDRSKDLMSIQYIKQIDYATTKMTKIFREKNICYCYIQIICQKRSRCPLQDRPGLRTVACMVSEILTKNICLLTTMNKIAGFWEVFLKE